MALDLSTQHKIEFYQQNAIEGAPELWLAPMAAICNAPFRLLMQKLGTDLTVSELISAHGINYGNKRTLDMLTILPEEQRIGIQLFGEDADSMAEAAVVVQEKTRAEFIDINMGCPVRKVVTKGGGSALLQDLEKLPAYLRKIKSVLKIPLTIKIRTGWDQDSINAHEVCKIAEGEGIKWVAIHGRTRTQQYQGHANWDFIEEVASEATLPIIGNGDLHTASLTRKRLLETKCSALMLARGPLRDPFIFLTSRLRSDEKVQREAPSFNGDDYWNILSYYIELVRECDFPERATLTQIRKIAVWFASGFHGAAHFRSEIFSNQDLESCIDLAREFFCGLGVRGKHLKLDEPFMTSGHG